ncbi:MAG TPA: FemAB family XrtA/PEP-CTERM system-associated protein [Gammaproteobacteria bacterium]|nr:FemAB family XrtA/PEP-CTERM system-associated protein [Gammaproteobacteria bacterium]
MSAEPVAMHEAPPRIRAHEPGRDADWDRYAEAHPGYTIYHGRAFHDAVTAAFGKTSHGLVAEDGAGRIVGILPLVRQRSRLFGDRLVSLPYANHGGPLADSPTIAHDLLAAAAAHADALGCDRLEVRDPGERALDWPVHTDKVLMTRALPGSAEALGRELGAKLRSQCRRALKEGATVEFGGAGLIPAFYRVFATNMRDLGTPVYPVRWFEALAQHLGARLEFAVVSLAGEAVAGAVLVRWKGTMEIPWAASARAYQRYAVNMLLYRAALDHAVEINCTRFDFGRSTRGSGTWRFKKQWGAEETQIYWRVRHRDGAIPAEGAHGGEGRMTGLLQRAWMRLPLGVANRVGPMISAELPW